MQKWWNENKETNFEVTPKFILNTMNGIQQNQLIFAENMKSHIEAIKTLSKEVNGLGKAIGGIKKENIKLKLGKQNNWLSPVFNITELTSSKLTLNL